MGSLNEAQPDVLKDYIAKGKNIFLVGPHGIGKTSMVRQAVKSLGWNLKEFNTALMDAQLDMTGIPQIVDVIDEDGITTKVMKMIRQQNLDEADVLMFDEFSRGHVHTLNAIMNVINDRMVNDEILPNLKSVVVATNPMKDSTTGISYSASFVDEAIMDRFDVYMSLNTKVDEDYLYQALCDYSKKNNLEYSETSLEKIAASISRWQHSLKFAESTGKRRSPYVSPRRCEKMGCLFLEFPRKRTLNDALGVSYEELATKRLYLSLKEAISEDIADNNDIIKNWVDVLRINKGSQKVSDYDEITSDIIVMNMEEMRSIAHDIAEKYNSRSQESVSLRSFLINTVSHNDIDFNDRTKVQDFYQILVAQYDDKLSKQKS